MCVNCPRESAYQKPCCKSTPKSTVPQRAQPAFSSVNKHQILEHLSDAGLGMFPYELCYLTGITRMTGKQVEKRASSLIVLRLLEPILACFRSLEFESVVIAG